MGNLQCLGRQLPRLPVHRLRRLQLARLAVQRDGERLTAAFAEWRLQMQTLARCALGKHVGRRRSQPLIELAASRRLAIIDALLGGGHLVLQRFPASPIGSGRHHDDGRRILDIAVTSPLRGVIEEGRHFVELALRQRIEFVVVAHGAVGGQAHPHSRSRLGAVARVEHEVLFVDDATFVRGHIAAVEAGTNQLLQRGIGQQVAGQADARELVDTACCC